MNSDYIMAVDVGERRIGVAVASTAARLAAPLTTIDRLVDTDSAGKIGELIDRENAGLLVVGLPRGLSGQETKQTKSVRRFAAMLSDRLDVPVVLQDEAGTSLEAERLLKNRGKPYQKSDIDSEAAALILRDYLNESARKFA